MTGNESLSLPESVQDAMRRASDQPILEGVPPHMMELFSDVQWPELVFQLQPSLQLVSPSANFAPDTFKARQSSGWVVFRSSEEVLARPAADEDVEGLSLFLAGFNFDHVAKVLWPDHNQPTRYRELTNLLIRWLEEDLIVDAGVPLPNDARFESDPDDATRSYASSRAPETENR